MAASRMLVHAGRKLRGCGLHAGRGSDKAETRPRPGGRCPAAHSATGGPPSTHAPRPGRTGHGLPRATPAAEQMISAGLKMCKGIRSISTEAHLLAMDQQVCNAKGDQARAARLAQRHATKTAELRALLRSASSGNVEGHEFILTWGLQQKA
ncbi:hypothetical protein HaLaN_11374 [Haematococcus lacustris]|uniref:Uncharacterized protein n=1 Tax=Haematococcus lacustris TaxID=44745 RepID=A0A699YZP4_HAELA|nr:hypothetical protein HaLaN_11374 [Haematococcus lacustris]